MMHSHHLSLPTTYYIRKLLRQCQSELISVVAQGNSTFMDISIDLSQLVSNLYQGHEVQDILGNLERLVHQHQFMGKQPSNHPIASHQRQMIETQIFWLLGFQRVWAA